MYEIISFDGVTVPPYLQRGDSQNMGTGSAQTDFRQIPGGGFYRMRRTKRSPQGIRPVTKSCVIWGDSAADARAQLDAWRQKIGVYGKLTVRFFDGSQRWQWAELQDVDAPVAASVKGPYVPLSLIWQTAAQYWNGLIYRAWTVGDGSFLLGDGTAQLGQQDIAFSLNGPKTTLVTVTNNGTIDVTGLVIVYTSTTNVQTSVTLNNLRTGQTMTYSGGGFDLSDLRIDTRRMTVERVSRPVAITQIVRQYSLRDIIGVTTATAHDLASGRTVEISGTGMAGFDGFWPNIDVLDSTTFVAPVPAFVETTNLSNSGSVRQVEDIYASCMFLDAQRWFVLKPGVNQFFITTSADHPSDSLAFQFHDSYA